MTSRMRWRYGDTNPVLAAVDADTVIHVGDLLYLDVDDAKPVGSSPRRKKKFLGVAMQESRDGNTNHIRVATTGVFEFHCPEGTYELGDLVGIWGNQQVQKTTKVNAIARVARRAPVPTTEILVDIRSTVMTGGI